MGVVWYDTWADFDTDLNPAANPCEDANTFFDVHFAYSLDGGVTWNDGWAITDVHLQSAVGELPGLPCDQATMIIRDYIGLSATSDNQDNGIFHAVWTDLRMYTDAWREFGSSGDTGDVYGDKYVVTDPVHSMGDFDRDYDVDMDDFANFTTCGVTPLPAECEILDMNRDNEISNTDPSLFMQNCFTGPVTGGGDGAGGESTSEELAEDDPLEAMVAWCLEMMTDEERSELAGSVRDAAEGVGSLEAARMVAFADGIDPAE